MKVLALMVPNGSADMFVDKLQADGFQVFNVTPTGWIGLVYVKMFLNEEQEAFLRLKYESKMIHDLTAK